MKFRNFLSIAFFALAALCLLRHYFLEAQPIPSSIGCPHDNFVKKHVCEYCSTKEDAENFMEKNTNFGSRRTKNTVFGVAEITENLIQYELMNFNNEEACLSKTFQRTWTCTKPYGADSWQCNRDQGYCKSLTARNNGHLFYNNIECK